MTMRTQVQKITMMLYNIDMRLTTALCSIVQQKYKYVLRLLQIVIISLYCITQRAVPH